MKKFDVFIIGSGMAGMTIANKCASKGLTVAITDELPYGGTCALRGCDPKKVLIGATEVVDFATRLKGKGIDTVPTIDWSSLMAYKQTFVDPVPANIEKGYKKSGITTYHSPAKFISANRLVVDNETVEAGKIVVASGAKTRKLQIPGEEYTINSTNFLNLKELPQSLIFIGGGYIAFEFAHIAARSGAKVTIVHRGKSPLEKFEQDIVKHLVTATKELGIEILLETEVTEIQKENEQYTVTGNANGEPIKVSAQTVINSAGRTPAIFDLELDAANIKHGKKGITVNEYLQSVSNPNVYAAGDCADTKGLPLTPVAVMEGHIVSSNILKGNNNQPDYNAIPTVVFTLPSVASVGITEKEAQEQNLDIKVNFNSVPNWFNARRLNAKEYAYKTIIDKSSGKVLGAHLIGPYAEETINLFAMAIKAGLKANDIKSMIFSYPTLGADITYMV